MKNNSGRLLLFAVILTGFFSVKYAAYGKYADYLNDITSVRSAPFYFSSNYLGEASENKNYVIGSFNGRSYELEVEIKNNDNAYNFNEENRNFYYYVTAELYSDENYTTPIGGTAYKTWIRYGKNNEYVAAMAKAVKTPSGSEYIKIDNSGNDYNKHEWNDATYKTLGRLDGLKVASASQGTPSMADVVNGGKQTVLVSIEWANEINNDVYLKVTAHTVPPTSINTGDAISIRKIDETAIEQHEQLFPAAYTNAFTGGRSFPDVLSGYSTAKGLYASELIGKFKLSKGGSGSETRISRNVNVSDTDYAVLYTFTSNNTSKAKLHYNKGRLTPDASIGTSVEEEYYSTEDQRSYDSYVEIQLYANGSKSFYFYKSALTMEPPITEHDVCAEPIAN